MGIIKSGWLTLLRPRLRRGEKRVREKRNPPAHEAMARREVKKPVGLLGPVLFLQVKCFPWRNCLKQRGSESNNAKEGMLPRPASERSEVV